MKSLPRLLCPRLAILLMTLATASPSTLAAETLSTNTAPAWLTRPLALVDAVNLALERNGTLLQARSDLQAAHGIVLQTRAIALPKLQGSGVYQWTDQIEELQFALTNIAFNRENSWTAGIQLVQSIYEGGRIRSSLRSAKLTQEQALLQYQAAIADTVLHVRIAYYDVLLATQQIQVQQESLNLLEEELKNTRRREEAGTVPHFNTLRAEVEVANARPALIRAQNAHRIAKNNLTLLLGYDLPPEIWEDIPLQLTGTLDTEKRTVQLSAALAQAAERRPELAALRKAEALRREGVTAARAGNRPSIQVFGGHRWRSGNFEEDLATDISGWNAGAQITWNFFDGMSTYGKIREAKALQERAEFELEEATRRVALEVRTAHSTFIEATEVLESQAKVQEQADEALRLANVRAEAGAGIQLDVLSARTALTQARTTRIQAQRDYLAALARLERAVGMQTHEGLTPQRAETR